MTNGGAIMSAALIAPDKEPAERYNIIRNKLQVDKYMQTFFFEKKKNFHYYLD